MEWIQATMRSPSLKSYLMCSSSQSLFLRCSERQIEFKWRFAVPWPSSTRQRLPTIYDTLPTTTSPTCGEQLLRQWLTTTSLLWNSTQPRSAECMFPAEVLQVPWPLMREESELMSCPGSLREDSATSYTSIKLKMSSGLSLQELSLKVRKLKIRCKQLKATRQKLLAQTLIKPSPPQLFAKACAKKGISPQFFFRSCDSRWRRESNVSELKSLRRLLGLQIQESDLMSMLQEIDVSMSGTISQTQFFRYLRINKINKQQHQIPDPQPVASKEQPNVSDGIQEMLGDWLKERTKAPGASERGEEMRGKQNQQKKKEKEFVDLKEFKEILSRAFPDMTDEQMQTLFKKLDIASSGRVSIFDLQNLLVLLNSKKNKGQPSSNPESGKPALKQRQLGAGRVVQVCFESQTLDYKAVTFQSWRKGVNKVYYQKQERMRMYELFKKFDPAKKGSLDLSEVAALLLANIQRELEAQSVLAVLAFDIDCQRSNPQNFIATISQDSKVLKESDFSEALGRRLKLSRGQAVRVFRCACGGTKSESCDSELMVLKLYQKRSSFRNKFIKLDPTFQLQSKNFKDSELYPGFTTVFRTLDSAIRACLLIQKGLQNSNILYWRDYQFGPSQEDPSGKRHFGQLLKDTDQVRWAPPDDKQLNLKFNLQEIYPKVESELRGTERLVRASGKNILIMKLIKQRPKQEFNQELLKREASTLFPSFFHQFQKIRIFVIRLYSFYGPVYVLMDPLVPLSFPSQVSLMSSSLWTILLEKAYAKLKGGFHCLQALESEQALRALRGNEWMMESLQQGERAKELILSQNQIAFQSTRSIQNVHCRISLKVPYLLLALAKSNNQICFIGCRDSPQDFLITQDPSTSQALKQSAQIMPTQSYIRLSQSKQFFDRILRKIVIPPFATVRLRQSREPSEALAQGQSLKRLLSFRVKVKQRTQVQMVLQSEEEREQCLLVLVNKSNDYSVSNVVERLQRLKKYHTFKILLEIGQYNFLPNYDHRGAIRHRIVLTHPPNRLSVSAYNARQESEVQEQTMGLSGESLRFVQERVVKQKFRSGRCCC